MTKKIGDKKIGYCQDCQAPEHPICSLTPGCPCCEVTLSSDDYRSSAVAACWVCNEPMVIDEYEFVHVECQDTDPDRIKTLIKEIDWLGDEIVRIADAIVAGELIGTTAEGLKEYNSLQVIAYTLDALRSIG